MQEEGGIHPSRKTPKITLTTDIFISYCTVRAAWNHLKTYRKRNPEAGIFHKCLMTSYQMQQKDKCIFPLVKITLFLCYEIRIVIFTNVGRRQHSNQIVSRSTSKPRGLTCAWFEAGKCFQGCSYCRSLCPEEELLVPALTICIDATKDARVFHRSDHSGGPSMGKTGGREVEKYTFHDSATALMLSLTGI